MSLFGPIDEAPIAQSRPDIPVSLFGGDVAGVLKNVLQPGDVFVDVGAKNGVGATLIASQLVGATGRVIAFEPDIAKFARLVHNVALNRAANTMCFPLAASDETIHATLYCEFPHSPNAPSGHSIRVQRVDTLCAKLGCNPVRLVKVDAPASELLVLRGMTGLFRQELPPAVLCQVSGWAPQSLNEGRDGLINFMTDFGYVPRQLGPTQITRLPGAAPHVRFTLWFSNSSVRF